jgi:hypothetical protein
MRPERVIRAEEVAGSWRYFVPLHILLHPAAPNGHSIVLNQLGWNNSLSRESNRAAYSAVQAINAINGVQVIDLRHLNDGTSRLNILVAVWAPEDAHHRIISALRDFFMLPDCSVVGSPAV